jgi:hypothetical protein
LRSARDGAGNTVPSEKIGIFFPFYIRIPPAGRCPTLPAGRDIDLDFDRGAALFQGAPFAGAMPCGLVAALWPAFCHGLQLLGGRVLPIARRYPTKSIFRLANCLFREENSLACRIISGVKPSLEARNYPSKKIRQQLILSGKKMKKIFP